MEKDCIFCKIVAGHLPAHVVAESQDVLVIKDIHPRAPIHYLIIPRKHVVHLGHLAAEDQDVAASLLMMAQRLSQQDERAREFRLVSNNGATAGQEVFHTHLHFLAGKDFSL